MPATLFESVELVLRLTMSEPLLARSIVFVLPSDPVAPPLPICNVPPSTVALPRGVSIPSTMRLPPLPTVRVAVTLLPERVSAPVLLLTTIVPAVTGPASTVMFVAPRPVKVTLSLLTNAMFSGSPAWFQLVEFVFQELFSMPFHTKS